MKRPAVNSNTKTEIMATSDIRKAVLFVASRLDVDEDDVVVNQRRRRLPAATVNKNRVKLII